jgi:antitoxin (DNA-binding transcriptional repressor) of toxin-antitoxin stability system
MQGVNAGEIRHVTVIGEAVAGIVPITVDSDFTDKTEDTVAFCISPFKKIATVNVAFGSNISDMFFDIKNRNKGKKFLLKFHFLGARPALEICEGQFYYEDKGLK